MLAGTVETIISENDLAEKRRQDFLSKNKIPKKRENSFLKQDALFKLLDKILKEKLQILDKKRDEPTFYLDKNELADPVDEASVNVQASQELRFRNREVFYLRKLEKSLRKIQDGTYGLCQDCNDEIAIERLMARPTAELCIYCKEEAELGEKNSILGKKSKSLGKSFKELN